MASQGWPPGLPSAPRLAELVETAPNLVVRSEMDVGPAKVRRRVVAGVTTGQMAINITRKQRGLRLAFRLRRAERDRAQASASPSRMAKRISSARVVSPSFFMMRS